MVVEGVCKDEEVRTVARCPGTIGASGKRAIVILRLIQGILSLVRQLGPLCFTSEASFHQWVIAQEVPRAHEESLPSLTRVYSSLT